MKNKIIFCILAMLISFAANKATAQNTFYAVFETNNNNTLTFKFGDKGSESSPYVFDLTVGADGPGWVANETVRNMVKQVVFAPSFDDARPSSCKMWFYRCGNLNSISGLQYLHTDNVTDMSSMFKECSGFTTLDLRNFNTASVKNMADMFSFCSSLTTLNLSNFNTAAVTDMGAMFSECKNLTTILIDENKWNTTAVDHSAYMFLDCISLIGNDGTIFDASKINKYQAHAGSGGYLTTGNYKIFYDLDASDNIINIEPVAGAIAEYEGGSEVTLPTLTASEENGEFKSWQRTTQDASGNVVLETSTTMTIAATETGNRIYSAKGVQERYVYYDNSNSTLYFRFDDKKPKTNAYSLNKGNTEPEWLKHSGDIENVVIETPLTPSTFYKWFAGCSKLKTLDLTNINPKKATDMTSMFDGCSNLTAILVDNVKWDFGVIWDNVTFENAEDMFAGCNMLIGEDGTWIYPGTVGKTYAFVIDPWGNGGGYLTAGKYKIFYDLDDGEFENGSWLPNDENLYIQEYDNDNVLLKTPTKEGYVFLGWARETSKGVFTDPSTTVTVAKNSGNYRFKAIWGQPYAVYDAVNTTFTFKCGDKNSEESSYTYDLLKDDGNPGWYQKAAPKKSTKVVFDPSFDVARPTNCYTWFYAFISLKSISGLQYFHTDEVTTMESMFEACGLLERLDLSHFNTSSVTTMENMFNGMSAVKAIYVGDKWKTASTTTNMFLKCESLVGGLGTPYDGSVVDGTRAKIDGGTTDKGYFTDIAKHGYAVYDNGKLTFKCGEIPADVQVTVYELPWGETPSWMEHKTDITEVDFESGFKDVYVSSCEKWFYGCTTLATITGLTNLNTSNVTNMSSMFGGCTALSSIDLSKFNTERVTDMSGMFEDCTLLASIDLSSFDTKNVENFDGMFSGCTALTKLPTISKITLKENTAVVVEGMFAGSGLTEIDLRHWAGNDVTSFTYLFQNCKSLTKVNLSGVITTNATSIDYMFDGCSALESVDLSNSVTDNVTTMYNLFQGCKSLKVLDLSSFNTKEVTNMGSLFDGCENLTTIKVKAEGWNTAKVTAEGGNSTCIFQKADNLIGDKGTTPKDAAATGPYSKFAHPDGGTSDPGYLSTSDKYKIFYNGIDDDDKTLDTYTNAVTEFLNEEVTLKNPTKPGYIFDGWTGTPITGLPSTPTKDVTIPADAVGNRIYTAHWTVVPEYAVYNSGTLTFKYGDKSTESSGTVYAIPTDGSKPGWVTDGNNSSITTVVCDQSFDASRPVSCAHWFEGCAILTSLSGMQYFHTDEVESMESMFSGCEVLTVLDLHYFDTGKVTNMLHMFYNAHNLRTIVAGANWTTTKIVESGKSSEMFYECTNIVGGRGTTFDPTYRDKTYAKIDGGPDNKGFLTGIDNYGYAVYHEGTLTFNRGTKPASIEGTVYELPWGETPSWMEHKTDITKVDFESGFKDVFISTCSGWFADCAALTTIKNLSNLNTSTIVNMENMFSGCKNLSSIDLSSFNTQSVIYFNKMFANCEKLTTLPGISKITLNKNVSIWVDGMFSGSGLTAIDLSHWAGNQVGGFSSLFEGCTSLKTVNLSGVITANASSLNKMFYGCSALESVDLSNSVTESVDDMSAMFQGCESLEVIDLSSFNTTSVGVIGSMFAGCTNLTTIKVGTGWSVSCNSENVFLGDKKLIGDKGTLYKSNITSDCGYARIDGGKSNPGYLTTGDYKIFYKWSDDDAEAEYHDYEPSTYSYSSTEAVTIPNPTTRPNTGAKFLYWTRLISADEESSSSENLQIAAKEEGNRVYVMHWAVPYAELSSDKKTLTFKNGEKPTSGTVFYLPEAAINPNDAPAWYGNVSNVTKVVFEASIAPTTCRYWFGGMTNLQEIVGMENYFDTKDVEDMESMFFGCSSLTGELDISSLNTANVKNMSGMFSGCPSITSIKFGSNFSTANVKYMISMFSGCAGLTSLNLNGFNTASVERMNDMFSGCSSLKALDLRGFNTGMVTDMSQMFYNCSSLTAILVGADWNTEKVIFDENNQVGGSRDMFASCSELIGNYGARVGTSNDKTYAYATASDGNKNGYLTANDYKIFYNGIDDDDATLDTYTGAVTKYLNEEVTLATPTKAGYIFEGWTGTPITGLPSTPTKDVTIPADAVGNRIYTAHWTVVPAYAVYDNGTLTFKVGDSNSETGNVYAIPTDGSAPDWLDKKANITTVVFAPSFDDARPVNCKQWFSECAKLTSVSGLQYFHTDNVTDMSDMFYGCKAIRLLNLVTFNTSKVTNMASMFSNMDELKVIYADGNNFKVSNTATTTNMFYNCKNLVGGAGTPYDASIVDGTRAKVDGGEGSEGYFTDVANYGYAVYNSGKLTFKKGVEPAGLQGTVYELVPVNMSYTEKDNEGNPQTLTGNKPGWYNVRENITEVEFESGFESVIVRTCFDWFKGCTNLTTITGLTNLNTSEVTDMSNMFNGCVNLGTIDISNFNTQNVWDFRYMFANCAKVSSLAVEKITFNTTKYPNLKIYVEGMFSGSGLTSVDVKHWSTTPLSSYTQLFAGCSKLQSVNVTGIVTAATSSIDYMFQGCSSLKSVDASSFVTSGVTHMNNLFDGCSGLTSVDVSSFNTGNVRYMTSMFEGCSSLNVLDISSFNTQSVEDMNRMFALCDNLTTIKVSSSGWTTSSLVTSNSKQNLFKNDYSLIGNDGTFCDISIYGNNPVEDALYAHAGNGGYLTTGDYKIFYDIDIDDGYVIFTPTDQITLKDGSATISASYAGGTAVSLPALADRDADDPFKNWVRTTQNSAGQIVNGSDAVSAIAATEKGNRIYTAKWTLSKEKYVTFDAAAGTLTFKYDADKPATGTYSLNSGSTAPEWSGVSSNIKSVVFEDAMLPSTCYHWFAGCTGLTVLDLTKLNTSKVTNMEGMFDGCTNLTAILVGDVWSTANVSESDDMFNGCTSLIGDGGVWAATGDLDKTYAFARDENGNAGYLTKGKYKIFFKENGGVFSSTFTSPLEYDNNVTLANPTKSNSVFWGWKQATAYDKSQGKLVFSAPSKEVKVNKNSGNYYFEVVWGTPYAVLSDDGKTLTFGVYDTKPDGAHDLNTTGDPDWIDGTNANITKVKFEESFKDARPTTCRLWFSKMSQLENIENLTYLNTSSVTSLFGMFSGCVKLTSLDFSKFNTAQVATMGQMFSGCEGLTVLDLSSFATKDALMTNQMFESCKNLTTIKVSASWDNEKITGTSEKMFDGCTALIGNSGKTVDAVIDATCAHAGTNGYLTTGDYKIFYNGIDDDATTLDTYTGAVSSFLDEKVTLKTPTKDGYTFSGWTGTSITGLTTPTKEVTIAANAAGNRIYTAHWTANEYSLNLPEGWEAYDESNNKITTATIGQKVFVKYKSTGGKTPKNVKVFPMPKSISITTTSPQTLAVGKRLQLEWSILPKDDVLPEDLKVTWESSEVSVATVSSDGIVTAVDTGTATITAETVNGKTATIIINVE